MTNSYRVNHNFLLTYSNVNFKILIMKRNLLLSALSIFICSLGFSQAINHVDYGESGLKISLNESFSMDIDNDGVTDFYINSWEDELGFTPIFGAGCFITEQFPNLTPWGSSILTTLSEGDVIEITPLNMYDYLDDGRGSAYRSGEGTTFQWSDSKENYIGFAVFQQGTGAVTNGWMKMKINESDETLVILEYAYHDYVPEIGMANIVIGDRGIVNVQNLDDVLSNVSIAPNPAQDIFSINYNFQGDDNIQISIFDNVGKEVLNTTGNNQSKLIFDASTWTNGTYFVNFKTDKGVHTERNIESLLYLSFTCRSKAFLQHIVYMQYSCIFALSGNQQLCNVFILKYFHGFCDQTITFDRLRILSHYLSSFG